MNLLLLLSALFSALTGVGAAVRGPDAVQAVAGAALARPVAAIARRIVTARPVAGLPRPSDVAYAGAAALPVAIDGIPLWATRRRE